MQDKIIQQYAEDIKAISSVIETYIEGGKKGDASIMKQVFRENATMHGYFDGDLLAVPIQVLYDFVAENPDSPELHVENISIDVVNTIATAKIETTKWLDHHFTDQFTLFKEDGKWLIVSKVFHAH
ncbi:MAG TPA: nuclear transport factor 2 family protein [Nitrosopumilaceae archaeon]|nr:nuclear transport factor 2 family protein [Nitrosopumilaceae archaeon]